MIGSFCEWEKNLTLPTMNFNVSCIKELASSSGIECTKDPQHTQILKNKKCMQMLLWTKREWKIFPLNYKFNCRQSLLDDNIGKIMKVVEKSNGNFQIL